MNPELESLERVSALIRAVRTTGALVHVSPGGKASAIRARGVLCPAASGGGGMDSQGSNINVVQLLDYSLVSQTSALGQFRDMVLSNDCFAGGAAVFVFDRALRLAPEFANHTEVERTCDAQRPVWRLYPCTEVWWKAHVLGPQSIIGEYSVLPSVL